MMTNNTSRMRLVFGCLLAAGCGSEAPLAPTGGAAGEPTASSASARNWVHQGAARQTHRASTAHTLSPEERAYLASPAARAAQPVRPSGTVLEDEQGQEYRAALEPTHVAAAVRAYDRAHATEGPPAVVSPEELPWRAAGDGTTRTIRGNDDRVRISTSLLDNNPYQMIVRYTIPMSGNTVASCTGTLIGARYVATAAHCVYDRDDDAWIYGTNGSRGQVCINGTCANVIARKRSAEWDNATDLNYRQHDYAMLKLDADLGTTNDTMLLSRITDSSTIRDLNVRHYGFPGTPPDGTAASSSNMWGMFCDITDVLANRLAYNCDTTRGHSGGPVFYLNSDGNYYMVAVHSGGAVFDNTGTKVADVRDWFITEMSGW